ncbi:MAG: alpha/beta hydrolase family esterase [Gammaproteobacteria bacterium]
MPPTRPRLSPLAILCALTLLCACSEPVQMGSAVYRHDATTPRCEPGSRPGAAGITNRESTSKEVPFNVRTPVNYDPTIAHPLLVVYAAAGNNRYETEGITGLTTEATARGFIVAYPDHLRLSLPVLEELATIPTLVAGKWCIDEARIYLTGQSDGGMAADAIAFLSKTRGTADAIAPSAAGVNGKDLAEYRCPEPLPVMVMHSKNDTVFPGYGAEAASWWAACNRCDPTPGSQATNGCVAYANCANGVRTLYCEGSGAHEDWPPMNSAVLDFFEAHGAMHR